MAGSEKAVKFQVRRLLEAYNAWFFMPSGNGFGRAGIPDFIGVHLGRMFGVETKAAGQHTTRLQSIEIARIMASGGRCFVVEGTDNTEELRIWLSRKQA